MSYRQWLEQADLYALNLDGCMCASRMKDALRPPVSIAQGERNLRNRVSAPSDHFELVIYRRSSSQRRKTFAGPVWDALPNKISVSRALLCRERERVEADVLRLVCWSTIHRFSPALTDGQSNSTSTYQRHATTWSNKKPFKRRIIWS